MDMILHQAFPLARLLPDQTPTAVVWHLVKHCVSWPVSRLTFLLPRFCDTSFAATDGRNVILVPEDLTIQVYKGVENALYAVYDDLPEGGNLDFTAIGEKVQSFLR
jgi:hypothetical protein